MVTNDFFKEKTAGPSKEITLQRALQLACGYRVFLSKRLSPPMTVCNGRLYCGEEFVYSSDIDIYKLRHAIARVAEEFGVVIKLLSETGDAVYWSSDTLEVWLRHWNEKSNAYEPRAIEEVYPEYEILAKERQLQWAKDHGLAEEKKPIGKIKFKNLKHRFKQTKSKRRG